jgi:uncharacterized protein YdaU (DUF1376 family)
MAKDPAVLFYTSDFLSGTMTMSNEHVGMYIRLLCLQHQKGKLTEHDMLYICTTYVEHVYSKFEKDSEGFYFNKRLLEEAEKRKKYSDSRKRNIKKRYDKKKELSQPTHVPTHVVHMEDESVNENESTSKDYNIEELKNYLQAELPELGLDAPLVSSMQFDLIDSFVLECEVFQKMANWKTYIERIKKSDWLMRRATGKGQKKTKLSLKWLCKADTVRDVMAGDFDTVKTVSDGREFI